MRAAEAVAKKKKKQDNKEISTDEKKQFDMYTDDPKDDPNV